MTFNTSNVIERTVGSAGTLPGGGDPDYASFAAWNIATALVAADTTEVAVQVGPTDDSGPIVITADGWPRSATQRRAITVHADYTHSGLLGGTPHMSINQGSYVLQIGDSLDPEDYLIVEGLLIRNHNRTNGLGLYIHPSSGWAQLHRCIIDAAILALRAPSTAKGNYVTQCLLHCEAATDHNTHFYQYNDDTKMTANTFVGGNEVTGNSASAGVIENCVLFGQVIPTSLNYYGGSHNASDYSSVTDGGTHFNATDWLKITSADFADSASGDYTPAAASKLATAGQDARAIVLGHADAGYTPPVDVDLAGSVRPATGTEWHVGALQHMQAAMSTRSFTPEALAALI